MDIETKGLGAGSYPEPEEIPTKDVTIKLYITCEIEDEFPKDMENDEIISYVKGNLNDYCLDNANPIIEDIEVE